MSKKHFKNPFRSETSLKIFSSKDQSFEQILPNKESSTNSEEFIYIETKNLHYDLMNHLNGNDILRLVFEKYSLSNKSASEEDSHLSNTVPSNSASNSFSMRKLLKRPRSNSNSSSGSPPVRNEILKQAPIGSSKAPRTISGRRGSEDNTNTAVVSNKNKIGNSLVDYKMRQLQIEKLSRRQLLRIFLRFKNSVPISQYRSRSIDGEIKCFNGREAVDTVLKILTHECLISKQFMWLTLYTYCNNLFKSAQKGSSQNLSKNNLPSYEKIFENLPETPSLESIVDIDRSVAENILQYYFKLGWIYHYKYRYPFLDVNNMHALYCFQSSKISEKPSSTLKTPSANTPAKTDSKKNYFDEEGITPLFDQVEIDTKCTGSLYSYYLSSVTNHLKNVKTLYENEEFNCLMGHLENKKVVENDNSKGIAHLEPQKEQPQKEQPKECPSITKTDNKIATKDEGKMTQVNTTLGGTFFLPKKSKEETIKNQTKVRGGSANASIPEKAKEVIRRQTSVSDAPPMTNKTAKSELIKQGSFMGELPVKTSFMGDFPQRKKVTQDEKPVQSMKSEEKGSKDVESSSSPILKRERGKAIKKESTNIEKRTNLSQKSTMKLSQTLGIESESDLSKAPINFIAYNIPFIIDYEVDSSLTVVDSSFHKMYVHSHKKETLQKSNMYVNLRSNIQTSLPSPFVGGSSKFLNKEALYEDHYHYHSIQNPILQLIQDPLLFESFSSIVNKPLDLKKQKNLRDLFIFGDKRKESIEPQHLQNLFLRKIKYDLQYYFNASNSQIQFSFDTINHLLSFNNVMSNCSIKKNVENPKRLSASSDSILNSDNSIEIYEEEYSDAVFPNGLKETEAINSTMQLLNIEDKKQREENAEQDTNSIESTSENIESRNNQLDNEALYKNQYSFNAVSTGASLQLSQIGYFLKDKIRLHFYNEEKEALKSQMELLEVGIKKYKEFKEMVLQQERDSKANLQQSTDNKSKYRKKLGNTKTKESNEASENNEDTFVYKNKVFKKLTSDQMFDLDTVLQEDSSREVFKNFCKCDHSDEAILFYEDVLQYQTNPSLELAKKIYDMYVPQNAPRSINLGSSLTKAIEKSFTKMKESQRVNPNIFNRAHAWVEKDMLDPFERFKALHSV